MEKFIFNWFSINYFCQKETNSNTANQASRIAVYGNYKMFSIHDLGYFFSLTLNYCSVLLNTFSKKDQLLMIFGSTAITNTDRCGLSRMHTII